MRCIIIPVYAGISSSELGQFIKLLILFIGANQCDMVMDRSMTASQLSYMATPSS